MDIQPDPSNAVPFSARYRWLLRAAVVAALALGFLAYGQTELLLGWVNVMFC